MVNDFPESVHGLRCRLANKYLQAVQQDYPPESRGYLLLRKFLQVLRLRDHAKAELRYSLLKSDVIRASKIELRQPMGPPCSCFTCPHHVKEKAMDQSSNVPQTEDVPIIPLP
ncbi:AV2 protein [Cajanus scarabaeoides yellow mosaic virus]|uniref:Protein V2 n=1 Tax=Cajanus scarabaeoides yellow mosaic virus TaxID=3000307 RepID=A0A9E8MGY5_9GEMI|nr:AV2 protein [Cajanus scarabaeoides yellow mosaic virus]